MVDHLGDFTDLRENGRVTVLKDYCVAEHTVWPLEANAGSREETRETET